MVVLHPELPSNCPTVLFRTFTSNTYKRLNPLGSSFYQQFLWQTGQSESPKCYLMEHRLPSESRAGDNHLWKWRPMLLSLPLVVSNSIPLKEQKEAHPLCLLGRAHSQGCSKGETGVHSGANFVATGLPFLPTLFNHIKESISTKWGFRIPPEEPSHQRSGDQTFSSSALSS